MALGPFPPSGNGEPEIGDKAPLAEFMEKTEMSLEALHTYTNEPVLLVVIPSGPLMFPFPPLGKGEPVTPESVPVAESNLNAEMVTSAVFGIYT